MLKIIGKENCVNCEGLKSYLESEKIQFTYEKIENLPLNEQKDVKKLAMKNKIMSFPLVFVDDKIITETELRNNLSLKITKRNGSLVNFDKSRIINAINNAMFETGEIDYNLSEKIASEIFSEVNSSNTVEDIQDFIIAKLEKYNRKDISKRYSQYRNKKTKEREIRTQSTDTKKLLSQEFISKYKHIKPPFTPLGEFVYYRTYSRWIPELKRREYWWETVQRVVEYNCSLLPTTVEEAEQLYDNIFNLRQFPSGRSLWIAGTKSAEEFPLSNFNCSFIVIDSFKKFGQCFHALMCGCGVGIRVLLEDVSKLPICNNEVEIIHKPYKSIRKKYRDENTSLHVKQNNVIIEIGDSKSGWVKALDFYFDVLSDKHYKTIKTITFDYDNVRPKGEKLLTFGGFASGHESIKNMFEKIHNIVKNRNNENLKPIECMDIADIIAENVVVGGTRRSAIISIIDENDQEIIDAKSNLYTQNSDGEWIENKDILHRRMSNNTIWYKTKPTREQLHWNIEKIRFSGEPAIGNEESALKRNPRAKGLNPCFSGDMKLLTSEGYKSFEELSGNDIDVVNINGEVTKGKVWYTGEKETVELSLSNKKKITCTPNHVFLTIDNKEVEAKDLTGIKIMPYVSNHKIFNDKYIKYGFMQGDGGLGRLDSDTHKGIEVNIGNKDNDIKFLFRNDEYTTPKCGRTIYLQGNYKNELNRLGFDSRPLPERNFPESYDEWNILNKASFLQGCYSANGSIIKTHRISYKVVSLGFAEKLIKTLRDDFGINSYMTTNKPKEIEFDNGVYQCKQSYDVNISKYEDIQKFHNEIGFYHLYKKIELRNLLIHKAPKVVAIKPNGIKKVYDFNEPNTHWGVVEGFIAHNCAEIILDDQQTCNLSVVNLMAFVNEDGTFDKNALFDAQRLSTRLCYRMTNVNLEMHEWDLVQKRDRLLGCDITGDQDFINATHMSREEWNKLLKELRDITRDSMKEIAKENNMNESLLVTAGKPNGSLALLPTVSAGIHYSHSPYYIRRVRISSSDPLCKVVEELGYPIYAEVGQDIETCDIKVIEFPVKAPEGKTKYDISAIEQLENYKDMITNYVEMNQSITISVKNHEWEDVEQWLWDNWDDVVAVSFLSLDDNFYTLMPYESCTKEEYEKRVSEMKAFNPNLLQKYEKQESTEDLESDTECASGACGIR